MLERRSIVATAPRQMAVKSKDLRIVFAADGRGEKVNKDFTSTESKTRRHN